MDSAMQYESVARRLTKQHSTLKELGVSLDTIRQMRDLGYRIQSQNSSKGRVYYITTALENAAVFVSGRSAKPQVIKWMELSDIHVGSKQFDDKGLRSVLKRAVDEGYKDVHISGDLCDGFKVYPGHMNNLRYWKAEDQAGQLVEILSCYDLNYYACKGNHDQSYEKHGSPNPIALAENLMHSDDRHFVYLDSMAGDLVIGGVLKRMVHLDGGRAYAKSYPGQTYIRNLLDSHGEDQYVGKHKYRIRFLQMGHFHTDIMYEAAGIYCTHPGNYQFPNDYTIRRGLVGYQGSRFTDTIIQDGRVIEYNSKFIKATR